MNVLETDHWCLLLPPEWWAEHDDDVVRVVDEDEVGELSFTTLCKESGDVAEAEVTAMAREESPEVERWAPVVAGSFRGVMGSFQEDDCHIREWYLSAGNTLLYVTYLCDSENAGMDDAAVDEILNTLIRGEE